jgi:hypothetical protein
MPKAILEFSLPEEKEEFKLAQNGSAYKYVIDELYAHIRALSKYQDKDSIDLEELREWLSNKVSEELEND